MNALEVVAASGAPHWSPFALVAAALAGFVIGALAVGFFALWWNRFWNRFEKRLGDELDLAAGSGESLAEVGAGGRVLRQVPLKRGNVR